MRLLFVLLAALRVAFLGDPQVDDKRELDYARKSIYKELKQRNDLDLIIVLGDLVNEKTDLIPPSEAILDSIGIPWYRVHGNHDGNVPVRDTSFSMGNTHFILMNNVRRLRKGGYEGGFSESQKAWLSKCIATIPDRGNVVLCTHIPVSHSRGLDSLANILAGRKNVLLVSGHTHCVERHIIERNTEEIIAGAGCGTWWRGERDSDGIPCALMNCGAPRGYFIADFNRCAKNWYQLSYKAVGRDDEASAFLKDSTLYVNVYGGSREGEVKVVVAGRCMNLRHRYCVSPDVMEIIEKNGKTDRSYRKAHKDEFLPFRRLPSPHIWAMELDSRTEDIVRKDGYIKIHYKDRNMKLDDSHLLLIDIISR